MESTLLTCDRAKVHIVAEIADPMNCFISIQGYQLLLNESKPGLGREMRNKAL